MPLVQASLPISFFWFDLWESFASFLIICLFWCAMGSGLYFEVSCSKKIIFGGFPSLMDFGGDPPPLPHELDAFKILVASCGKKKGGPSHRFVKKVDIPSIELSADRSLAYWQW